MPENPYESPKTPAQEVILARAASQSIDRTLWEIRKEAGNAVFASVIAFVLGIIFAPVAIMCGRKALRLIEYHGVGHEYAGRARLGIKLGYIGIGIMVFLFVLACVGLLFAVMLGV